VDLILADAVLSFAVLSLSTLQLAQKLALLLCLSNLVIAADRLLLFSNKAACHPMTAMWHNLRHLLIFRPSSFVLPSSAV
jgi:hypothetical protein